MKVDNGSIYFELGVDTSKVSTGLNNVKNLLQNLGKNTTDNTAIIQNAFKKFSDSLDKAWDNMNVVVETNRQKIKELEAQLREAEKLGSKAFQFGNDAEYRKQTQLQATLKRLIAERRKNISTIDEEAEKLRQSEQAFDKLKAKYDKVTASQSSFRTELRNAQNELRQMTAAGQTSGAKFDEVSQKIVRLTKAMNLATKQTKALASPTAGFQGVLNGLSGLSGGLSAVTGVMGLFASENENLQKIMTKVQSVMAITIGLQQVEQVLLKSSAFQINIVSKAKQKWTDILQKAGIIQRQETIAIKGNTAAQQRNTATTKAAGTVAAATTVKNGFLVGSIKAIGLAIKSIPVIGWVLAIGSAVIGVISKIISKNKEAKEEQKKILEEQKKNIENFYSAVAENSASTILKFRLLINQYKALGDSIKAKTRFIKENKNAFNDLGVSVNNVREADNLFIKNNDVFIQALRKRAEIIAYTELLQEEIKKQEIERQKQKQIDFLSQYSQNIQNGNPFANGQQVKEISFTLATPEQMEEYYNEYNLQQNTAYTQSVQNGQTYLKKIENQQNQLNEILEKAGIKQATTKEKQQKKEVDLFKKSLAEKKSAYDEYYKLINSGDEVLQDFAIKKYEKLLQTGETFIDYLKNQRDKILSITEEKRTATDNKNLDTLNSELANVTNQSVLQSFEKSLTSLINNEANSLLDKLKVIQDKRYEISKQSKELADKEIKILEDAQTKILDEAQKQLLAAQRQLTDYYNERLSEDERYLQNRIELEEQYKNATTDEQRNIISSQISALDTQEVLRQEKTNDAILEKYKSFIKKKEEIDKQYEKEKRAIELNYVHGNATAEEFAEQLGKAKQNYDNKIKSLNNEAIEGLKQNSELLVELFSDAGDKSVSKIKEILSNTKLLIDYLRGNKDNLSALQELGFTEEQLEQLKNSPEAISKIVESFDKLQEKLIEKNPFATLIQGINDFKEGYRKASEDVDVGSKKMENAINLIGKSINQIIDGIKPLTSELSNLFEGIGNQEMSDLFSSFGDTIDLVSGAVTSVTKFASGDILGGTVQAIQTVVKGISNILQSNKRHEEALKKIEQDRLDVLRAYNLELLKTNLEYKEGQAIFGYNIYGRAKNAVDNLKKSYGALNSAMSKGSEEDPYKALNDIKIVTGHEKTGIFGWGKGKDTYSSLLDIYPELIDADGKFNKTLAENIIKTRKFKKDEEKAAFQNLIDLYEQTEKATEELNNYLTDIFGDLGNTLTDALVDAFSNGTNAAQVFTDNVSQMLETLGKQMLYNAILQPIMEEYSTKIKEAMETEENDEDRWNKITGILYDMTDVLITSQENANKFLSNLKQVAAENGFTIFNGNTNSNNTVGNAVKTITSEEAGIIAGQMNAIRIQQIKIGNVADNSLSQLVAIRQNSEYLKFLPILQRIEMLLLGNSKVNTMSLRANGYLA